VEFFVRMMLPTSLVSRQKVTTPTITGVTVTQQNYWRHTRPYRPSPELYPYGSMTRTLQVATGRQSLGDIW